MAPVLLSILVGDCLAARIGHAGISVSSVYGQYTWGMQYSLRFCLLGQTYMDAWYMNFASDGTFCTC